MKKNKKNEQSVIFRLMHRLLLNPQIPEPPENRQTFWPPCRWLELTCTCFIIHTHTCSLKMIICPLIIDILKPLLCRGGPCNFPRSWLLPVLKENVQDTELKYFFDVMLPLSANLRNKGTVHYSVVRDTSRFARSLFRFSWVY